MKLLRLLALSGVLAAGSARADTESNFWPAEVDQLDATGRVASWQGLGPIFFEKPTAGGGEVFGARPFFAQWRNPDGAVRETNLLYPLFTYRVDDGTYRWSVFNLINRSGELGDGAAASHASARQAQSFDVWPLWFSKKGATPEDTYSGLLPVGGTIKHRFGYDQIEWAFFPFYGRVAKAGWATTATPWPFLKITRGTETGWALWPLYGTRSKPGAFERRYYLWPLAWNNTIQPGPDAPAGATPRREIGVLPFYTKEQSAGFVNENYLWPFFGYTDRTSPTRYHETRYLWPFLVQGRGADGRYVNRFGPFYTHSIKKDVDKTWIAWPLYCEIRSNEGRVDQTQRRVLYFLYRSTTQRSVTNPHAAPASRSTLWPLYSAWDNGAGRRQFQLLSPFDALYPEHERMRTSWAPLFALYRYDQPSPGTTRHEWFWGLLTSRRAPGESEFHLGPLFSTATKDSRRRIALLNGVVGLRHDAGTGWRFFSFDFNSAASSTAAASSR